MKSPYRVIVWGPGIVGTALIREILKKPELKLVGVLAYNPQKNGKDAGEYVGLGPVGVRMTTDQEAIFKLDADCVLFCPQVSVKTDVNSAITDIVCRFLESGKNVVTPIAYWYPQLHPEGLAERLEKACQKGGTCIHGTGINAGLLNERLVVAFTGVCTSISSIKVEEYSNNEHIESADMLGAIGYGQSPEHTNAFMDWVAHRGYSESIALTCHILGLKVDRIVPEKRYAVAKKDYHLKAMDVPKGTNCGVRYKYTAFVQDKPFMTLEEIWYIDPEAWGLPADCEDYYAFEIEGEPTSVRVKFDLLASAKNNQRFRPGDHTLPSFYATAAPLIQAIPIVCGAKPGIVLANCFCNFTPDLRDFKSPLIVR